MLQKIQNAVTPSTVRSLAGSFLWLGWAGFWLQVVFGSLPIIVMAYFFAFSGNARVSRSGLPFVEYLTMPLAFVCRKGITVNKGAIGRAEGGRAKRYSRGKARRRPKRHYLFELFPWFSRVPTS